MKVKLNDVIDRITGNVDRYNTELEYYVGGEHYECGRLAMYDKGLLDSEKGSTLGFKFHFPFQATDVLFMARNPHLKKAAMVMFDGICSDASYILRTKDESILQQRYIPLIIQNDNFWAFFEANKSGSVNYLMNWKEMKEYEFDLPDIKKQEELVELVWGIEETIAAYERLLAKTDELVKSQFIEMFGDPDLKDKGWLTKPMKQVAPEHRASIPEEESYWWLNLDMIESFTGTIIEKVIEQKSNIGNSTAPFDNTMVMYSKLRPYLNKVTVPDAYGYATTELVGLKPDGKVLNKFFLFNLLRGDQFVKYAVGLSAGGQMPRMPMKEFRQFECILPPMELQEKFVEFYKQSDKSKFELRKAIENLKQMQRTIIKENV